MYPDSKYSRLAIFLFLIAGWLGGILWLWQTDSPEFGAAAIGAGPVLLYAIYQEYVQRPIIVPESEVEYEISTLRDENPNLNNLPGEVVSAVSPGTQFEIIYPLIIAKISVKNKGLTTANDCYCHFSLGGSETYYGRWGDETNSQTMELHPGIKRNISLLRIFPDNFELSNLNPEEGEMKYISQNLFKILEPGRNTDGVTIDGYKYRAQRPVHIEKEERLLTFSSGAFAGYDISPEENYDLHIEFGAEDYSKEVKRRFKISVRDTIEQGIWETDIESHYPTLVDELVNRGWNPPSISEE